MAEKKEEKEKRVFAYLADHPDGTIIAELVKELRLSRLEVAEVLRALQEAGKAKREGLLYFAI